MRQNMYDMEEGEGSVWDRELSGKTDAAFEYRERVAPAAPAAKKPKVAAPRVQSAEEKERLGRNETMRRDKLKFAEARARFLEPHRGVLERFGVKLEQCSGGGGGGLIEDPSITQPKEILVPMRDYQVAGLRWLSAMHESVRERQHDPIGSLACV